MEKASLGVIPEGGRAVMLQGTRGTQDSGLRSPGGWWCGAPVYPLSSQPWRAELSADPSQNRSWTCSTLHLGTSDMWAGSFRVEGRCPVPCRMVSSTHLHPHSATSTMPAPPVKNASGHCWSPLALLGRLTSHFGAHHPMREGATLS